MLRRVVVQPTLSLWGDKVIMCHGKYPVCRHDCARVGNGRWPIQLTEFLTWESLLAACVGYYCLYYLMEMVKSIPPQCLKWIFELDWKLWCWFWHQWAIESHWNGANDWCGYSVMCLLSLPTWLLDSGHVFKGSNMIVCVLLVSNSRGCCLASRRDNTRGSLTPTIHTQSCLIPIITWCHHFIHSNQYSAH